MAEVEDIPQDLRGLARRVPPSTRAALTRFDLGSRCEAAAVLITEADQESDPLRAHRKRSQAGRFAAMTPEAYSAEVGRLRDELEEAKRRGDDQSAWQAGEDLRELDPASPPGTGREGPGPGRGGVYDRGREESQAVRPVIAGWPSMVPAQPQAPEREITHGYPYHRTPLKSRRDESRRHDHRRPRGRVLPGWLPYRFSPSPARCSPP